MMTKKTPLISQGTSLEEQSVYNFMRSLLPNKTIVKNDRNILKGKELDIYIPSKRLAIEFNGLYWHSSNMKDDPFYHINKSIEAEKAGVRLISIMSDEWEMKKPIVQDILRKAIGIYETVDRDSCEVLEISFREGESFLQNNSLDPVLNSKKYFAIRFSNETIAVASFSNTDNNWIMTNYCERKGYIVRDGVKAVLKVFNKKYNKAKLPIAVSCDRRYFRGVEFLEAGFQEITPTGPSFTITKNFKKRLKFKESKQLKEADLQKKGFYKVYDCGKRRFVLDFSLQKQK